MKGKKGICCVFSRLADSISHCYYRFPCLTSYSLILLPLFKSLLFPPLRPSPFSVFLNPLFCLFLYLSLPSVSVCLSPLLFMPSPYVCLFTPPLLLSPLSILNSWYLIIPSVSSAIPSPLSLFHSLFLVSSFPFTISSFPRALAYSLFIYFRYTRVLSHFHNPFLLLFHIYTQSIFFPFRLLISSQSILLFLRVCPLSYSVFGSSLIFSYFSYYISSPSNAVLSFLFLFPPYLLVFF